MSGCCNFEYFDADMTDQKVVVILSSDEQKNHDPTFDLAIGIAVLKELGMIGCDNDEITILRPWWSENEAV